MDVEVQSMGDSSIRIQDLEDARKEIIALSGIPAPYLGYQEVIELREQLVHSNLTFAQEIIDIQEGITKTLTQLVDFIGQKVDFQIKPSDYIETTLIPPVVLMLQLIELTMGSASNITSTFQNLQIPFDPFYFLEKYVPFINWDEFKADSEKTSQIQALTSQLGQQQQGGGGF